MRLVELAVNCLKETYHNDDYNLTVDNFLNGTIAQNPEYANEYNNLLLSINKAISRLLTSGVISYKTAAIEGKEKQFVYDLSSITDIRKVKTIYTIDTDRDEQPIIPIGWLKIDDTHYRLQKWSKWTIYIVYERKIKPFTEEDYASETDLEEYGISDELCYYINYFAKSELFEDRDPDRCKRYLNYFEQFVAEYSIVENLPHQRHIENRYRK